MKDLIELCQQTSLTEPRGDQRVSLGLATVAASRNRLLSLARRIEQPEDVLFEECQAGRYALDDRPMVTWTLQVLEEHLHTPLGLLRPLDLLGMHEMELDAVFLLLEDNPSLRFPTQGAWPIPEHACMVSECQAHADRLDCCYTVEFLVFNAVYGNTLRTGARHAPVRDR